MLMEKTVITPLLKKPNLKLEYKNYHPISNLPFISKLAEKSALLQINPFLNSTDTYSRNNSGYKPFHSTETILLKIHDNIIKAIDNRNLLLLVMLNLSSAFDTVNHKKISDILKDRFNFKGPPLKCLSSRQRRSIKVESIF